MRGWLGAVVAGLTLMVLPVAGAAASAPNLRASVPTRDGQFITRGDSLTLPATITNDGPGAAAGVALLTRPSAGLTITAFGGRGCPTEASSGLRRCPLGSIPAGGVRTVTITLRADEYGAAGVDLFVRTDGVPSGAPTFPYAATRPSRCRR